MKPVPVVPLLPAKFDTHCFAERGHPTAVASGVVHSSPPRVLGRLNKEVHIDQRELVLELETIQQGRNTNG